MKLKRTRSEKSKKQPGEKDRKGEALISRQAPGMCFDFNTKVTWKCQFNVNLVLCFRIMVQIKYHKNIFYRTSHGGSNCIHL